GGTGLIIGQKVLVRNRPVGCEYIVTRERYSIEHVPFRNVGIENAVLPDDCAALIGKQWIIDVMRVGKALEQRLRVITDGRDPQSGFLQLRQHLLQLDERRTSEGSPIGASRKN